MRVLLLTLLLLTLPLQAAPLDEDLAVARRVLESKGYELEGSTDGFLPENRFRVLIGKNPEDRQQAFFFYGDRFVDTDALEPSGRLRLEKVEGDTITLVYGLYRPEDQAEPSAGEYPVRFHYFEGRLKALDHLPPSGRQAALGRR